MMPALHTYNESACDELKEVAITFSSIIQHNGSIEVEEYEDTRGEFVMYMMVRDCTCLSGLHLSPALLIHRFTLLMSNISQSMDRAQNRVSVLPAGKEGNTICLPI